MITGSLCDNCGTPLSRTAHGKSRSRWCSTICSERAHKHPGAKRARQLGLPVECVPRFAVYNRDGWTCHLCGSETLRVIGALGPWAPTFDHVVPLSDPNSPGHVMSNVRTAHRVCNGSKQGRRKTEEGADMTMEKMGCVIECWPVAADVHGIWLVSGGDAWRSPSIPADSEPHFDLELLVASHDEPRPSLLHSTSWRPDGPTIVLTYVAVFPCDGLVLDQWPGALPVSADLLPTVGNPPPHGAAEVPVPRYIDVLHHALRHLTFLTQTDAPARAVVTGHWAIHLARLQPVLAGMYESADV